MVTGPILLVEDNEDDVFFMQRAMKNAEVTQPLKVVRDGQQAIDYLKGAAPYSDRSQNPLPCLVLLDLKMPYKSGHEVLQWIREQPSLKSLIVIILTTSRETRDVQKAYALNANAFLVKPPGAPQLMEMIRSLKEFWLVHNEFAPLRES
jgi:CheY-like chemotaxis protein